MNGIVCKPETLEKALINKGLYLDMFQGRNYESMFTFFRIMGPDKSEEEKLNELLEKGFIFEKDYNLLKRDISNEETIPRKIFVSYPRRFLDKLSVGPITLQEAMYTFCEHPRIIPEFNDRVSSAGCIYDGILKELYDLGFMNKLEYELVLKNIGRKNGKNIS